MYVYVHVHVCMYIRIGMGVYVYLYMCMCMHMCMYMYILLHVGAYHSASDIRCIVHVLRSKKFLVLVLDYSEERSLLISIYVQTV